MKRSVYLCLAALVFISGCSSEPTETPVTKEVTPEPTLTDEERAAIADLPVYQRDLEALANIYKNFNSSAVRTAVLDMRAKEIIRLLGEASSRRAVYNIEQKMIPEEHVSAKNALLDKKAALR
jgi:hypothetical protein